jgi:Ca-activated chloride channel family protein
VTRRIQRLLLAALLTPGWLPAEPAGPPRAQPSPQQSGDDQQILDAALDVQFPDRYRSRTVVEVTVTVPMAALLSGETEDELHFLIEGEVLRQEEVFETFRYLFDIPRESLSTDEVPIVVQRHLRPGSYTLAVRIEDLVGGSSFAERRELDVPVVSRRPVVAEAGRTPGIVTAPPAVDVAVDHSITLLRPPSGLHTGNLRVHARTTGEGIAKVAFELNGKRLMSKRQPPWSIEVDLGQAPRLHDLKAIAYDRDDSELASDEITVNAGPQRFAVRLVEPEPGRTYQGRLRARAVVDLPRGDRLDRLEFYLNTTLLSTLYQGPFVQSLLIPSGFGMAYVRAVAYLEDGHSTEELVFINSPTHLDRIDVDLVELYTTVVDRKGRPVEGLRQGDFSVLENRVPQTIRRFERAEDLPFHAAVVIDTSTSMADELRHAEKAALEFFEKVVTPRDRAAVVTFNDRPRLVVPFTSSLEMLAGGLAGMQAQGETALHDSVVFTLYHFGGLKGQRALILLSDGADSMSRYDFDDALEFARETGVAIYAIGLDIPTNEQEARSKLIRLCRETGGQQFFISRIAELDRVYQTIEQELRSQYLIAYQSSLEDDRSFRRVQVELSDPTYIAKTISGYRP